MLKPLLQLINMPGEASGRVMETARSYDFDKLAGAIRELTDPVRGRDFAMPFITETLAKDGDPQGWRMLTAHLLAADYSRHHGAWSEFPETIYADTMGCFSRFVREHKVSYGEYGFDRAFWTTRQLSCILWRFGCLEYEIVDRITDTQLPEELRLGLKDVPEGGTKEIHLHIASDSLLTEENIRTSVADARAYVSSHHPECSDYIWMCCSWLLSPELGKLLPEGSHIRTFQSFFDPVAFDPEPGAWYGWCFKIRDKDGNKLPLEALPETTSLQRAMKAHLLSGGKIGEGTGLLKI
ncbi:MAG: DUF5596 domain-containing protein [Lachnospiraceae bacterium]|nr:DUF5596 domain-containing protein [Lachnospiraceae bacterium]